MAASIGLDNHHLVEGDGRHEVSAEYTSANTSPFSYGFDGDQTMLGGDFIHSRHLLYEDVAKLSGISCSLTTTLRTDYKGWNAASGIMFTVLPSKDIELLTVEIPTFEDYSSDPSSEKNMQVYYRQGSFSGVMNNKAAWTKIADTNGKLVAPLPPPGSSDIDQDMGVIVPTSDFKKTALKQGEVYSIYIVGGPFSQNPKQTLLKLKPGDGVIGDKSSENEALEVQTGVRLKGEPFPMLFTDPADFNGVLHYQSARTCDDSSLFKLTEVNLLFAVNSDPNSSIMGSLRSAVEEIVKEWMKTSENLVRYADDHALKLDGLGTHFKGRNDKCPKDYDRCSLISTTLNFKHHHSLDEGLLQMEILARHKELDETVYSYVSSNADPVDSKYVGNPLSKVEFAITLSGVPDGELMNDVQQRYFGDVTTDFLRKHIESKVFDVVVQDAYPEYVVVNRNLAEKPMLRTRRSLQTASKIKVIAEVAAEGTVPDLRNMILEGIGNNRDQYTLELISHQLRPIDNNQGNFFNSLTDAQAKPYEAPKVDNNVGNDPGTSGNTTGTGPGTGGAGISSKPTGPEGRVYVIVCILLIVFSIFWIFYRIYMDCFYSPFEKPMQLSEKKEKDKKKKKGKRKSKNDMDEFKDEGTPENNGKGSLFGRKKGKKGKKKQSSDDRSRTSSSRSGKELKGSKSFGDDSCSLGDVESDDDDSVEESATDKRGKLKATKSLPKEKAMPERNKSMPLAERKKHLESKLAAKKKEQEEEKSTTKSRSSSSEPKRGKLRATKSMPVTKRSPGELSNTRKSATKSPRVPERSTPKRSSSTSGPKRGKLTATKSMPIEKRSSELKKKKKSKTDSPKDETPSSTKRGKLTPSKSLPVEKHKPRRSKSMDLAERKQHLESKLAVKKKFQEDTSPTMPASLKKRLESRSSHSHTTPRSNPNSKKLDRNSWHPDSKGSYKKKLEPRSSHSGSTTKKKSVEKTRGIKASKSMTRENRDEMRDRLVRLSDMYHDSTSDSDLSDSSSDDGFSSRKSYASSRSNSTSSDGRKSFGKAGRSRMGSSNGGLPDVAE